MLQHSPKGVRRSSSRGQTTITKRKIGPLQRQLRQGEYGLFRYSPMFESNFVQISKQGGPIEIHNQEQIVTVGITSTSPVYLIPNVMLLARPIVPTEEEIPLYKTMFQFSRPVAYELTRLFPLRYVKISIHSAERHQLRFKLANGRTFYLQLCSEPGKRERLFDAWIRIIQLLRPASETNADEQNKAQALKSTSSTSSRFAKSKLTNSPQSLPSKSISWNIHTATKTVSALENKTKKKKNSPPKSPKKAMKLKKSPPALPSPPASSSPPANPPSPASSPPQPPPEAALDDNHSRCIPTELVLEIVQKSPSEKGQAAEQPEPKRSPQSERKPKKTHTNRTRAEHRGVSRKPSKFAALFRACTWGRKKKKNRSAKAEGKGKKY